TNVLNSFTALLTSVQNDIRLRSSMEGAPTDPRTASMQRAVSFHTRTIDAFQPILVENRTEFFVFHRAFEALLVEDEMTNVDLNIDDAVACSACVIFNMALVHHLKFLRNAEDLGSKSKAEQLYVLALQALDRDAVSTHSGLQNVFLWVQLGALNNLGTLKCCHHTTSEEDARCYFVELMRVLNFVEQEELHFRPLLQEAEWNGMTRNCLAMLFNMSANPKIALAA
ncbi:MAG: hypothetical protein SGILL_008408, partial [Bacillariaceae sp.]